LIVIFSLDSSIGSTFRSTANLQNIFGNQSVTGLIALGMVVPLVGGYFDLSVAAIAGVASVTFAAISGTHHQSVGVGIAAGILLALLFGAANGVLVAVLRLNPFVTTFGTYVIISGLLELYTRGQTIGAGLPADLNNWSSTKLLGIALPFWLLMLIALIVWYLLTQTPFGRRLTAIGSNEAAARLSGFRVSRMLFISYVIAALLAGIAGVVLTSQTVGADSSTAQGYLFPALAAVFLGQTAIRPGQYNVWGTIFGVYLVAVAVDGLTLMGAQSWITNVFNGGALVLSVAVSTLAARGRDRRASNALMRVAREAADAQGEKRGGEAELVR
jgi:ribose transport system permease protein